MALQDLAMAELSRTMAAVTVVARERLPVQIHRRHRAARLLLLTVPEFPWLSGDFNGDGIQDLAVSQTLPPTTAVSAYCWAMVLEASRRAPGARSRVEGAPNPWWLATSMGTGSRTLRQ